jgi:hypothetical protein
MGTSLWESGLSFLRKLVFAHERPVFALSNATHCPLTRCRCGAPDTTTCELLHRAQKTLPFLRITIV